jgi:hypothetical protein
LPPRLHRRAALAAPPGLLAAMDGAMPQRLHAD